MQVQCVYNSFPVKMKISKVYKYIYRLGRVSRLRIFEDQKVQLKKEQIYAERLGYDLLGNCGSLHRGRKSGASILFGFKSHDPILQQAIHVEAMSAFPLATLR